MSFVNPDFSEHVVDFAPGFQDSGETNALPKGATPDALNCFFDRVGPQGASLKKRDGASLLNSAAMSLGASVDGLSEYPRPGFPPQLVAVCDGIAYHYESGGAAFAALVDGTGFTPGASAGSLVFRSQLYLYDGTNQLRYDGTSCYPIGFAKPTSVTDMTVTAPSGAGVTGTYESLYVWYDSVSDHESSPTEATTAVVFTADARRHTKPGGSPPTNVDYWRAYVRRTDTYEASFFLAGTFAIGSATGDEEASDTARRELAPLANSNDEPPNFKAMAAWRGYVFGLVLDDYNLHVSKQGDGQSWHPKEVFPVRAGGRDLRSVSVFGTELVLQSPRRSWHLVGTRVPFAIEEISGEWGNVSPDSGVEVDEFFYAWDEQRGPYRTDTLRWQSLADNRIEGVLASVNRDALRSIRAQVFPKANLVVWLVPTGTQARPRTLIAYDYSLNAWLPPITGFEYTALSRFTSTVGETGLYMGDAWGRVYQLFTGGVDGPPSGTTTATVTSATATTVTCDDATFYTTDDALAGMPVACLSASGALQWRRILSNTATTITLDTTHDNPWGIVPLAGWTILVGGIHWFWTSPWWTGGEPDVMKRGAFLMLQGRADENNTGITIRGRFNDVEATAQRKVYLYGSLDVGSVWGTARWGLSAWGGGSGTTRKTRKQRIGRTFHSCQFQFSNPYPNQAFTMVSYRVTADRLPRRRARNV